MFPDWSPLCALEQNPAKNQSRTHTGPDESGDLYDTASKSLPLDSGIFVKTLNKTPTKTQDGHWDTAFISGPAVCITYKA